MDLFTIILISLGAGALGGFGFVMLGWLQDKSHKSGGSTPANSAGPQGEVMQTMCFRPAYIKPPAPVTYDDNEQPPYRSVPEAGYQPVDRGETPTPPGPETPAAVLETVDDVHRFYVSKLRTWREELEADMTRVLEGKDSVEIIVDVPAIHAHGPNADTFQLITTSGYLTTLTVSR